MYFWTMILKFSLIVVLGFFVTPGTATMRPIIGILMQEINPAIQKHYPDADSYIAASYVKSVQAAGARVVPIFINQTVSYYESLLNSINGILLPGGRTWFNNTGGYADAAGIMYELIKNMNQKNDIFPVLSICLGLEVLLYIDNKREENRVDCHSRNILLPLNFKPDFKSSSLFSDAPENIINILEKKPTTFNEHIFCLTEEKLKEHKLDGRWRVLSTNEDDNNIEFVSILESTSFPIVGLQFHPEKMYEWRKDRHHPHSPEAIRGLRYFFDWFITQARLSSHSFPDLKTELASLISNYPSTFTNEKLVYDEIYLFKHKTE